MCGVTHAAQTDYGGETEAAKGAKNTLLRHGHGGQKQQGPWDNFTLVQKKETGGPYNIREWFY